MANNPPKKGEEAPASLKPKDKSKMSSVPWTVIMAIGVLLFVASITICYTVLPDELPWAFQKLVGLMMAGLAMGVFFLVSYRPEREDLKNRIQRGQHVDFGKKLRSEKKKGGTIKLPLLGSTSFRSIGCVLTFLVVAGWWFTPLAPIDVKAPRIVDLAVPLGDEIMVVMLTLADESLATAYPPVVPNQVERLADRIGKNATPYQLTMKAVAEGRHEEARVLLDSLTGVPAGKIRLVRCQNEILGHQFVKAAELYQEALEADPNNTTLLGQTVAALIHAGNYDLALETADRAVDLCRQKGATSNRQLGIALHLQTSVSILRGRNLEEVETLLIESQSILRESFGEESSFYAASLNNQAILSALRGRLPGARNAISLAHSIWSISYEPDHPYLAANRISEAVLYYLQGEPLEALKVEREMRPMPVDAESIEERTRPDFDRHVTGLLELATNQPLDEMSNLERDLPALENWLGSDHPQILASLNVLTDLYIARSRYRKAEVYAVRALEQAKKVSGNQPDDSHPCMAEPLGRLTRLYLLTDRHDEALARAEEALSHSQAALGDEHLAVARDLCRLGRALRANDKSAQARQPIEQAVEILEATFPDGHPRLARALGDLASFHNTPSRYRQGANQFKRAIEMMEKRLGENHPDVAQLLADLSRLYIDRSKFDLAEPYVRRAIKIRKETLPPHHPLLADSIDLYADWLMGAEPDTSKHKVQDLQKQAQEIRDRHGEIDRPE